MSGAIHPLPQHAFMAWCLVKSTGSDICSSVERYPCHALSYEELRQSACSMSENSERISTKFGVRGLHINLSSEFNFGPYLSTVIPNLH
jgi:hypothetical protein